MGGGKAGEILMAQDKQELQGRRGSQLRLSPASGKASLFPATYTGPWVGGMGEEERAEGRRERGARTSK